MDIKKALTTNSSRSKILQIVDYVNVNVVRFNQLVNVFLSGPYRITQRAAGPLGYCVQKHPHLLMPHLKLILDVLGSPDAPVAVRRNTLRLLQFIEIPKPFHGRIINLCFGYLSDRKEPVAIKVFAMTVLANLTSQVPEIERELKIVIDGLLPYGSPAFISRARKILKRFP